jgi:hypothetical protein
MQTLPFYKLVLMVPGTGFVTVAPLGCCLIGDEQKQQ